LSVKVTHTFFIRRHDPSFEKSLFSITPSRTIIQADNSSVPLNVSYMPDLKAKMAGSSDDTSDSDKMSGYFATFNEENLCLHVPIYTLYHDFLENGLHQASDIDLCCMELMAFIFGECEDVSVHDPYEKIFVMAVRNNGCYYDRVGHMELAYGYCWISPIIPYSPNGIAKEVWHKVLRLLFRRKERRVIRLG
jgi:hypothetical protein